MTNSITGVLARGASVRADDATNGRLPPSSTQPHSVDWLISPVSRDEFFQDYWEKRTLVVHRQQRGYFSSLLSFEDVDRVITTLDRRYPDICLKNADDPGLSHTAYTLADGSLDVVKLYELFEKGSTITLAFLDNVLPALGVFCRSLEGEFSCPFQTNIYMTPPGAQGAAPHYDTHDVFVLQVAGSKRWTIFGTPVESPLPNQRFDDKVHQPGPVTLEFELQAGDVAYIPRGVAHEARSSDAISLHITTGVLVQTWADFLVNCIAGASLENPALRKALPPGFAQSGFDRTRARDLARDLLQQAANGANYDTTMDGFIEKFLSKCAPVLEGQMNQLAMLDRLTVGSVVGARPGVIARVTSDGASQSIETYGRRISFPIQATDAIRFALNRSRFIVSDLPGGLDDAGKLTIIRRLIREGLVMALPD